MRKLFLAGSALALIAFMSIASSAVARECEWPDTFASPSCDGDAVVIYFPAPLTNGCTPASYTLQRRGAGGTTWQTIASNPTSPYTDHPPLIGPGKGGTWEYRLVLLCLGCNDSDISPILGPISCP